jgi:hypothetical protein
MYRLYHKIPKGLDPVANVFKQVGFFTPLPNAISLYLAFVFILSVMMYFDDCLIAAYYR